MNQPALGCLIVHVQAQAPFVSALPWRAGFNNASTTKPVERATPSIAEAPQLFAMEMTDNAGALLTHLVLLPNPVPLPDGSTWTRNLDLPAPGLSGIERRIVPEGPLAEPTGFNFVSMKFWQVTEPGANSYEAMSHVADVITGTDRSGRSTGAPLDEAIRTVVSLVTWVEDPSNQAEASQALTRCIEELLAFHRSYRLGVNALVHELTYERIVPLVMRLDRPLVGDLSTEVSGKTLLDHMNIPDLAPRTLEEDARRRIARFSERLSVGDPFVLYAERRLQSLLLERVDGRYGESVVQTAIAAEILLDGTLGLMMWEEAERGEIADAYAIEAFSTDFLPRLKSRYHPRLGGQWSLEGENLSPWYEHIANPRGRVVHGGYRPTREESMSAREALITLERFIGNRLAAKFPKYPKTAWLFLGDSGFATRGRSNAASRWASELTQPLVPTQLGWIRDYGAWRAIVNGGVQRR